MPVATSELPLIEFDWISPSLPPCDFFILRYMYLHFHDYCVRSPCHMRIMWYPLFSQELPNAMNNRLYSYPCKLHAESFQFSPCCFYCRLPSTALIGLWRLEMAPLSVRESVLCNLVQHPWWPRSDCVGLKFVILRVLENLVYLCLASVMGDSAGILKIGAFSVLLYFHMIMFPECSLFVWICVLISSSFIHHHNICLSSECCKCLSLCMYL